METFADKVEALRAQVGARTVEDVVKSAIKTAQSYEPVSLAEAVAMLGQSEDPAAQRAYEGFVAWAEDVEEWLEDFTEEWGAEVPSSAATSEAEEQLSGATNERSAVTPVEKAFWTKAVEIEGQLQSLASLMDDIKESPVSPELVRKLVLQEYQQFVEDARTAVEDELSKADDITGTSASEIPAELKPQLA